VKLPVAAWGIDADTPCECLRDGSVYRIGSFVLKTFGTFEPPRLDFIESVTKHMNANGIVAHAPIRTLDGHLSVEQDGKNYAMWTYVEGAAPAEWSREVLTDVGRTIGRMHCVLATYPTDDLGKVTWHQDLPEHLPRWVAGIPPKLDAEHLAIHERFERTMLSVARQALTGLPEQLIHRDCHGGNIIYTPDDAYAFIDCDHFCVAPRIFELAYFMSSNASDFENVDANSPWFDGVSALLAGYDETAHVRDEEREAFPYAVMSVFAMMADWGEDRDWVRANVRGLGWAMDALPEITRAAGGPSSTRP
jgi:Ser/Thr protein kinase RdoA (MazF antagonist)